MGRVSELGDKPISYKIGLLITQEHFHFVRVGATLEECFVLKDGNWDDAGIKTKDVPLSILRANLKPKVGVEPGAVEDEDIPLSQWKK
jgi:hypothetical protein